MKYENVVRRHQGGVCWAQRINLEQSNSLISIPLNLKPQVRHFIGVDLVRGLLD